MVKYFYFLMLFGLSFSCQVQDIERYNSDFSGEWRTDPFYSPSAGDTVRNYFTVDGRDSGFGIGCNLDCSFCDCLSFFVGRIRFNTSNNSIQIGGTVNQILQVKEEPFINEQGIWELKLEELSYFKFN